MRILYDGYAFSSGPPGGICRYFQQLIGHLPREWSPHLTFRDPPGAIFPEHPALSTHHVPDWTARMRPLRGPMSNVYNRAYEMITSCNVVHPTYYESLMYRAVKSHRAPLVLTVHDMIDEILPGDIDPDGHRATIKRAAIEAADAILCVSESTRHDLQRLYRIPDARITVTYLASSLVEPAGPVDESNRRIRPYVLFVGSRAPYKNFGRLLRALAEARRSWKDLSLGVCGAPFTAEEKALARTLGLANAIHHLGFAPDQRLAQLYHDAEALLYPSLYEGFGIPPLEAMACGTVVIASNRSSLPEVVGDAGILVNPESVQEITDAMLQLRNPGQQRETLIKRGKERAARFTWEKTSSATMAVYRSLAA